MAVVPDMLQARGIELWRGDACLFHDLDLEVAAGDLLHVCGPNGIGKTSLLRVLCGLSEPEEGEIRWRGTPIRRERESFHAQLAFLGHRDGLKSDLNARENLAFSLGMRTRAARARVDAAIGELGLQGIQARPARVLSAGQRRRVAFARVLLSQARLWVLDEPFSNLDEAGREWGHAQLSAHAAGGGLAVVTSHHGLALEGVAARVLELG